MDGSNLPQVEMFPYQGVESRISKKGNLGFQDMLPDWGICITNAGFFFMIPWMVPIYHNWKCFHTRVWKLEFPRKENWISKICYQTGVFVFPRPLHESKDQVLNVFTVNVPHMESQLPRKGILHCY